MSNPRRKWSVKVAGSKRRVLVDAGYCKLDEVAYIRFASVYRRFQDLNEFREEIERLAREPSKE